jgi:hypothetical protein
MGPFRILNLVLKTPMILSTWILTLAILLVLSEEVLLNFVIIKLLVLLFIKEGVINFAPLDEIYSSTKNPLSAKITSPGKICFKYPL